MSIRTSHQDKLLGMKILIDSNQIHLYSDMTGNLLSLLYKLNSISNTPGKFLNHCRIDLLDMMNYMLLFRSEVHFQLCKLGMLMPMKSRFRRGLCRLNMQDQLNYQM